MFQNNACVVNRYYCELINQARKGNKYPLPVFVPQRSTGPRKINRMCVRLFGCAQSWRCHTFMRYCFIAVFVRGCLWGQLYAADAGLYLSTALCEYKHNQMIIQQKYTINSMGLSCLRNDREGYCSVILTIWAGSPRVKKQNSPTSHGWLEICNSLKWHAF